MERHGEYVAVWGARRYGSARGGFCSGRRPPSQGARGVGPGLRRVGPGLEQAPNRRRPKARGESGLASNRLHRPGIPRRAGWGRPHRARCMSVSEPDEGG